MLELKDAIKKSFQYLDLMYEGLYTSRPEGLQMSSENLLRSNWFPNGPNKDQLKEINNFRNGENAVRSNWNPNGDQAYIELQNAHQALKNNDKFGGGA